MSSGGGAQAVQSLDWQRMFLGDYDLLFYVEIVIRTLIILVWLLALLRVAGKRGVSQLSPLELAIVIGLGSAVGDAMFYAEVPLVHAMLVMALVAVVLAATAVWMTWDTRTQLHSLEQELVRRQQGSADQSAEALVLARQAQEVSRDSAAKAALLEARLAEVALQRGQLDDLIQSLSRSRDENVVADIEAAIRVAMQQSALTGSAEPLVVALRSADDRLARINQPRLERLRRAIASDLDRVRSVGVPDIGALLIKIDEVVRLADELPLVSEAAITGRHAGEAPGDGRRRPSQVPPCHARAAQPAHRPHPPVPRRRSGCWPGRVRSTRSGASCAASCVSRASSVPRPC